MLYQSGVTSRLCSDILALRCVGVQRSIARDNRNIYTFLQGSMSLALGYHMVKADWFENGGGANMVSGIGVAFLLSFSRTFSCLYVTSASMWSVKRSVC